MTAKVLFLILPSQSVTVRDASPFFCVTLEKVDWCELQCSGHCLQNLALASTRQMQLPEIIKDQGSPLSIPQQGGTSCKARSKCSLVHLLGGKQNALHPPGASAQ